MKILLADPQYMSLNPPAPGSDPDSVLQFLQRKEQGTAAAWNVRDAANYQNSIFPYWKDMYEKGAFGFDAQPPQPPKEWVVQVEDNEWDMGLVRGDQPLCPIPDYKRVAVPQVPTTPNHFHVGAAVVGGGGSWFTCPPDDTVGSGFKTPPGTTSDDGVVGIFEKYKAAVGNGWYLKVG